MKTQSHRQSSPIDVWGLASTAAAAAAAAAPVRVSESLIMEKRAGGQLLKI